MKDFDDLWRISHSDIELDPKTLLKLFKYRGTKPHLDKAWLNPVLKKDWERYSKSCKELPKELEKVFNIVNEWLENMRD